MESPAPVPVPATSLMARMVNVFATPGEVFDEVKHARPATANWLVPVLLAIVIGIISIVTIYSQPAVIQQIRDQQGKVFDDQVKAGKMTQAQADQAQAAAGKIMGPAMMEILGSVSVVIMVFIRLFWWALVLWLLGKWFFQADYTYEKALEVTGLAFTLTILASIVVTLVCVLLGRLTLINLALLDPNGSPQGFLHMIMSSLDLFDIWLAAIISVGLARLANVSWGKAATVTGAYWILMQLFIITLSWSVFHIMSGLKHP